MKAPGFRPLKVYAFDPGQGRNLGNLMTLPVTYEPVAPGPIGARLAVIDYDAANDCYYDPVDLDAPEVLINNGLEPTESDPRFHQQMVYAVASETIRYFERALGRTAKFGFRRTRTGPLRHHLRIMPHAMAEANAYYSHESKRDAGRSS